MFYSHTFLARKGPLGTVWCAAHLQHKLRKSHYISTNVTSTAERIMYPQVPIALRMSAHLLLGVVRIYSKQVDYLYEDCNEIQITINRVFTTVNINLPHDATHASLHSVTFPEKLDLDALELDDYFKDLGDDSHLKSQAEITLTEQIPTGNDPYIIIHFDEQDLRASSLTEDNSGIGPTPMDEDVPPIELDTRTPAGLKDPSSSHQLGADDRNVGNMSPKNLSSPEIMRNAAHSFDFNNSPILPDRAAPDKFLEEQISKDNETFTPATEEMPFPDGHPLSHNLEEQQQSLGHLNPSIPFVRASPEMEIQQSPPVRQPNVQRKRKQFFDEVTVLNNRHMKKALNDTSNILRVRRNCPTSSLSVWKQNNRLLLRKEDVIFEPFMNGTCADLQAVYKEDLISAKFQRTNTEETHQGETNAAQPLSTRRDSDIVIETLRNNECTSPDRNAPPFSTVVPSPSGRSYFTPEKSNLGLQSEHLETTEGDGLLPTADVGPSGNLDSEMETPDSFYEKGLQAEHTAFSDIPELVPSAGELGFLEQDDNSPAGSKLTPGIGIFSKNQGTPELQALSSRTRAVAQYLKMQCSVTPIVENSDESSEDLSLNKILEGKPRKICARMFFETLALKTNGLVDVNQENPYGDIILKVTPKLSKGQFSG